MSKTKLKAVELDCTNSSTFVTVDVTWKRTTVLIVTEDRL